MSPPSKRILVTGSQGFIGKNLVVRLQEQDNVEVLRFDRGDPVSDIPELIAKADAVVHLAGENRPEDERAFDEVNRGLTETICSAIRAEQARSVRKVPVVFSSSTQAELDNPYGRSKRAAELALKQLANNTETPVTLFRLPGVFGKWARPNYNSVVANFCYNISRDLPIRIDNPAAEFKLVYIDDCATAILTALERRDGTFLRAEVSPVYSITLGDLAELLRSFEADRKRQFTHRVGTGLTRALYATYVSYLPVPEFSYNLPAHGDERGVFVEMLKTPESGQFSYFTAHPGITRGGHYHHSKVEKFLVIKGEALFRFRHILTDERVEVITSGDQPQVVETIPGWSHDVTNTGMDELVVILWANEVFERDHPDTIASKV